MVYLHVTNYPRPSSLFDFPPPCNYNVHIRGRRPGTEAMYNNIDYRNQGIIIEKVVIGRTLVCCTCCACVIASHYKTSLD